MAHPQTSWIGQTVGDRYRIEAQLGQGGMSTVYRANDPNLHRKVAIKLIHSHLSSDPEFVRRFEQEASAVAQLRHPNIIQVYDFDHDGDVYYMVLEHVPGETLHDRLETLCNADQTMAPSEVVQIMATICDAVAYAHQRGMIHRDLKPANVMLNTAGQPILMDFGVAKMLGGTQHTATGDVIGTVSYMSPEQARGERPDERADIYSMGVMLFEMVTGRRPFEADSAVSVMMKHLMEPVPDILQIKADTPRALVTVVERALAKLPSERYQSAADMATALRASLKMDAATDARQFTAPAQPASQAKPAAVTKVSAPATVAGAAAEKRPFPLRFVLAGVAAVAAVAAFVLLATAPQANAPALPPAEGMAQIDAGVYLIGLDAADDDHAPLQQVVLKEYWIDQYEVTNEQYEAFVQATGGERPVSWLGGSYPPDQARHPVEGVTWRQAALYCEWTKKRLPTEAEWEVAARGPEHYLYPWGNSADMVELPRSGTYAAGSLGGNRSRYGVFDMAGNVWEWVSDAYVAIADGQQMLRGGSNGFLKDMAFRLVGDPTQATMIATAGFRCAAPQVEGLVARSATRAPAATVALPADVLFYDDFTNPASGWPSGDEGNYSYGYHPQAFYHLEVSAANDRLTMFRGLAFDNFIAETDVLVDHTDTDAGDFRYGLAFRRSGDAYYAFMVSPRAQAWRVVKHSADGEEVLAEGAVGSLRGLRKAPDQLRVEAGGSRFVLKVNGETVAQLSDADYTGGEIGFIAETADETLAHIHYASLTLRQPAESSTLLYADDFTDPGSGWPNVDEANHFFGYHPPDFYHVEVNAPNTGAVAFGGLDIQDFTAEAKVQVDHMDTDSGDFRYGLAFRGSGERYYAFAVSARRSVWQVLKVEAGEVQILAEGPAGQLRGLDHVNDTLRVDASGSRFAFHINGRAVTQLDDSDFTGGDIGFYVETFDETLAHVHFDGLTVREVETGAIASAPTAVPAPTATLEPTAAPTVEATPIPVPEGMALVPAGYFMMGASDGRSDEAPEHPVLIDAFYIDLYEVSNAQYRACVDAGACTRAGRLNSFTRTGYRDAPAFDEYPVIGVTWDQAISYCGFAGKRLPTEAEWEYAASGPENLTWPWGNTFDAGLSAASAPDTQPVGSYPDGRSPFGVFDMAGNVTEWVADVYNGQEFFSESPASNPLNTGGGDTRIFRGGSFANRQGESYRTSRRYINNRGYDDVDIGIRCAQDAPEVNASIPPDERETRVAEFCPLYAEYRPDAPCP